MPRVLWGGTARAGLRVLKNAVFRRSNYTSAVRTFRSRHKLNAAAVIKNCHVTGPRIVGGEIDFRCLAITTGAKNPQIQFVLKVTPELQSQSP